jgi:hypothetical protein
MKPELLKQNFFSHFVSILIDSQRLRKHNTINIIYYTMYNVNNKIFYKIKLINKPEF